MALAEKVMKIRPPRCMTAAPSFTWCPTVSHACVGLLMRTGSPVIAHGLDIAARYRLVPLPSSGSLWAQHRYRVDPCVKVVASRENESRGVVICPRSVQAPLIGSAAVFSRAYMRMRQTSSARPAAK